MNLEIRWLGRVHYPDALTLQEELVAERGLQHGQVEEREGDAKPDVLLLLEHEPIYTIGRTQDQSSLRDTATLPHPVVQINRGGQATYHGPGQLVGYPILDLRKRGQDLHRYLRELEETLIEGLIPFGIHGQRRDGLTGVWVEDRKIASIGVGVRRWVSMHGFALNVCGDMSPFAAITPCGLAGVEMTNMEREARCPVDVKTAAESIGAALVRRFGS